MAPQSSSSNSSWNPRTESDFQTTDWSVLSRLDTPDFAEALATLCQQYWYPVYAFVRRRTRDTHRAEDLTQAFFCKVISMRTFRMADRDRGRFRAFLLTAVKNFLATEYEASQTQKRGGDHKLLSLDFGIAERMYEHNQKQSQPTPENEFDRAWAVSLIEHAIDRLRHEYDARNDRERFGLFVPLLRFEKLNYAEVSSTLGISETTARKAASRFRSEFSQQLRRVISETLADGENLEAEIDWMLSVLQDG